MVEDLEGTLATQGEQLKRLRDDLKVKEQYIESMEDECRVAWRRVSDLENDLKTVKKECVDALSAKESALATQYK